MSPSAPSQTNSDAVLAEIVEEFTNRLQAGEAVDAESYAQRHPEHAERIRQLLPALALLAEVGHSADSDSAGAPRDAAEEALSGTLGDFRLLREVGRGGMGIVYEAEQISLKRRVALKVLPFAATMDPRHLQRFHNEAQAAACLHHTNIVPVHFVGCERGVHFYAMQFIEGHPLSDIISHLHEAEKKTPAAAGETRTIAYQPAPGDAPTPRPVADMTPLTGEGRRGRDYFRKVAELGVQAAEALDHAHQLGIVHRDIKPANLLLDARGNLWVTDFGLAHIQHGEGNLTMTGQALGTPRYMSPEQALAKRVPIDHRTDVYSLGATLYELLTLQPAFASTDRQEVLRQIAFEDPAHPRRLSKAIPAELEIIVLKAMEKRPQDRYATAQELADDLRRWLMNEPIRARRPTVVQRLRKWSRRHQAALWAASLVLAIVLAVLAGSAGWVARDQAMQRAETDRVVKAALEESASWQDKRRLPEALSAAHRARDLLAGRPADQALQRHVQARVNDLELLDRLENVRLEKNTAVKDGHFDGEGADALFGQTFREAGLDVEALPAEEAGERIRRSTVAVELATVLYYWAAIRQAIKGPNDSSSQALLSVACLADPDTLRTHVREALERRDKQALLAVASSEEVLNLPPATLFLLGSTLWKEKRVIGQTETFLREAQRRHPNDFWLNEILYEFFQAMQPPRLEESLRFAAVAVALRPESSGAHVNLGIALKEKGQLDEAIAEYREAIRIKRDYAEAHTNLGLALKLKGQLDEAIAEHREAIRLKKDFEVAHRNLGIALQEKGQLDKAFAAYHEAIRIKKDYAEAHCSLGVALKDKGQPEEAIAAFRDAIRINKDYAEAHSNLGGMLKIKGQLNEAIAAYREALRINKDYAEAHYNLGLVLMAKGQLDEAIAEFRAALRLKKDWAEAHCNLGLALEQKGQFAEALEHRRRGHELGSKNPSWPHPSAQWVRNCERLVELDGKLPAILSGQKQPAETAERLDLAYMCQMPCKKHYPAAVRFFRDAFAEESKLAHDLNAQHRYNAAYTAALAGCGQGVDADKLDDKERARLREQALDWLRADLNAYRQVMETSAGKAGPIIAQRMQHWLGDTNFTGVRGEEALTKLPETERQAWHKLWQEVETLRQLFYEKGSSGRASRP